MCSNIYVSMQVCKCSNKISKKFLNQVWKFMSIKIKCGEGNCVFSNKGLLAYIWRQNLQSIRLISTRSPADESLFSYTTKINYVIIRKKIVTYKRITIFQMKVKKVFLVIFSTSISKHYALKLEFNQSQQWN